MKKLFIFIFLISVFSINAFAVNTDEYYKEQLEASGAKELSDSLSDETEGYLEKLGFDELEPEKLLDSSPKAIFSLIWDMIKKGFREPLKEMLKITGVVLLISVCSGFFPDDEKSKSVLNLVCGSFITIGIFAPAAASIRAAVSAIEACVIFEKALIPVLAAILTVSGNPAAALSSSGAAFTAAQFIESFASETALPLIGTAGALGITGSMLPTLRLSAVSEIIRKTLITVLSTGVALFSGFLSFKSLLASAADGMAVKGVKLAASTFVPVVGGALSEAYTSVLGSLSLLKTTVGIYGIAAILLTALPVIINLALWVLAVRFTCAVSDLLDCRQCSELLKNISFVFSMVNTLLLLCVAVFVITAGLTVLIKSGE